MHMTCPVDNRTALSLPEIDSFLKNFGATVGECQADPSFPNSAGGQCNIDIDWPTAMNHMNQVGDIRRANLLADLAQQQSGDTEAALDIHLWGWGRGRGTTSQHISKSLITVTSAGHTYTRVREWHIVAVTPASVVSFTTLTPLTSSATPTAVTSLKGPESKVPELDNERSNLEGEKGFMKLLSSEASVLDRTMLAIFLVALLFLVYI
jgi:hypothetical protein